jgi:hypothetical protein
MEHITSCYLRPRLICPQGASFWFGHGKLELGTATGYIHDVWAKTIKNPHPHFYRYLGFGGEEKIIPTSAEAARQIMNNEAFEMPFWFREGSKPLLGDGLVNAEGNAHKVMTSKHGMGLLLNTIPGFEKIRCSSFQSRSSSLLCT